MVISHISLQQMCQSLTHVQGTAKRCKPMMPVQGWYGPILGAGTDKTQGRVTSVLARACGAVLWNTCLKSHWENGTAPWMIGHLSRA